MTLGLLLSVVIGTSLAGYGNIHLMILTFLACGLLGSVNWVVSLYHQAVANGADPDPDATKRAGGKED